MLVPLRVSMLGGRIDVWALILLVLLMSSAFLLATIACLMVSTLRHGKTATREFIPPKVSSKRLAVFSGVMLTFCGIFCVWWTWIPPGIDPATPVNLSGEGILLFERSMQLTSGVSLLTPSVLLWGAASVWLFTRLQRLFLKDRARVDTPWPHPESSASTDSALASSIEGMEFTRNSIESLVNNPCSALPKAVGFIFWLVAMGVVAWIGWILFRSRPVPDGWLAIALLLAFLSLFAVWVHWLFEAGYLLIKLRKLMRQVGWTPLLAAVTRLPHRARTQLGDFLRGHLGM